MCLSLTSYMDCWVWLVYWLKMVSNLDLSSETKESYPSAFVASTRYPSRSLHLKFIFTSRFLTNSISHIGDGRIATPSSNEQLNSRPPPSTRASLPLTSSSHHPEFCADKGVVFTNCKTHSCHCPKVPLLEMTTQISNQDTPDPWMIKYNGTYILTFTTGDRVEIWRSSLLHDFHDNVAAKRVVW